MVVDCDNNEFPATRKWNMYGLSDYILMSSKTWFLNHTEKQYRHFYRYHNWTSIAIPQNKQSRFLWIDSTILLPDVIPLFDKLLILIEASLKYHDTKSG